jgi:hypothetical protein
MTTGEGFGSLKEEAVNLPSSPLRTSLMSAIAEIEAQLARAGLDASTNLALLAGLRSIENEHLRNALESIISTAETVQDAEEKLIEWFDDGMERTSNAFKRRMQYISLIIGCFLAVVLNIDTLHIARTLWEDEGLRETITTTIEKTDIAELEEIVAQVKEFSAQAVGDDANIEDELETDDVGIEQIEQKGVDVGKSFQRLSDLRLPIGWNFERLDDEPEDENFVGNSRYLWNFVPWNYGGWLKLWIAKILGIGATMIAIAQGAPFWFGILRRLSGGSA